MNRWQSPRYAAVVLGESPRSTSRCVRKDSRRAGRELCEEAAWGMRSRFYSVTGKKRTSMSMKMFVKMFMNGGSYPFPGSHSVWKIPSRSIRS